MIKLLNQISYVDSVLSQISSEVYKIEHHLVKEMIVRNQILTSIQNGKNYFDAGSFKVFFFNKETATEFMRAHGEVKIGDSFNDGDRYQTLLKLFADIGMEIDDYHTKLKKELPNNLTLPKESEKAYADFFAKNFFFNLDNYYVVTQDHNNNFRTISKAKEFNTEIIQFLIFHTFRAESFDKMMNSIVEPLFLSMEERMAFLSYKSGLKTSVKITRKILDHQLKQGDITKEDYQQIIRFMAGGYLALRNAQKAVHEEIKSGVKRPKYVNFIKRPYLVHQLMIDILKLAIFAEGRTKTNIHNEVIYTGRESGFEGGNTVAVHGYNNYLKYNQMLKLITPVLNKDTEIFDNLESFKAWVLMAMHDAATYDRQNAIGFGSQLKYGNNNKKAHSLIGGYVLREHDIVKKLFKANTVEEIETEEKKDLNLLATIIANHDYQWIHLDALRTDAGDNKIIIKKLILFTLSGLADNSAGIGFIDEYGHVKVDPWEEKGSTVFMVRGNEHFFFEILNKIAETGNDKYYDKDPQGKAEWKKILAQVVLNINRSESGIVKEKLLRGINAGEFSARSAFLVAGVLNSGVINFKEYDGTTLRFEIIQDKKINDLMKKTIGETYCYDRINKFLQDYKEHGLFTPGSSVKGGKIGLLNTDLNQKPIKGSVGVEITIREQADVLNTTLIESASKQLLRSGVDFAYKKEFKIKAA